MLSRSVRFRACKNTARDGSTISGLSKLRQLPRLLGGVWVGNAFGRHRCYVTRGDLSFSFFHLNQIVSLLRLG